MRKSVLRQFPRVSASLAALLLLASLLVAGCGGGGGSNDNPGTGTGTGTGGGTGVPSTQNPNLAYVTGRVLALNTGIPVSGATIRVTGTNISAQSGSDGRFTLLNLPTASASVTVDVPSGYYRYVQVNTRQYSQTKPCPIPLPKLNVGANAFQYDFLLPSDTSPPGPPDQIQTCPTN